MTVTLTDQGYVDETGKSYDRATSIVKLAYVDDPFQFVKPKDMEVATRRGSAIHRLTSNEAEDGDEEWKDWAEGWINFKSDTGYQEIASEMPVWSETYSTAGTLDSYGIFDNRAEVIEKKTTAGIPLTLGIQTSGYKGMLAEMIERGYFGHVLRGKNPPGWATIAVTAPSDQASIYKPEWDASGYFSPRNDRESITKMLTRQLMPRGRRLVWMRPHFSRGYKLIGEGDMILINGKRQALLGPSDWQTFLGLLMVKRWRERFLKTKTKENPSAGPEPIEWR